MAGADALWAVKNIAIAVGLVAALALSACDETESSAGSTGSTGSTSGGTGGSGGGDVELQPNTVTCLVDGVELVPTQVTYTDHLAATYTNTILAEDSVNAQYVVFSLRDTNDVPVVAKYTLGPTSGAILGMQSADGGFSTQYGAGSGTLEFTEVTATEVKGTFSGTIYTNLQPIKSKVITKGRFRVTRQ